MPIVVDRPPADQADEAPPGTVPRRRRQWWRYLFPWVKTAVSAPTEGNDLLIVNATGEAWLLSLGYRALGVVPPYGRRAVTVVRTGLLCARQVDAPTGTAYLTLSLTPAVHAVEISCTVLQGEQLYQLSPLESRRVFARLTPRLGRPAPR